MAIHHDAVVDFQSQVFSKFGIGDNADTDDDQLGLNDDAIF